MPVIKSAKKKLRQDRKRERENDALRTLVKKSIKKTEKSYSDSTVRLAVSIVDKAAKRGIFHKNRAARMKAQLARLANTKKSSK